MTVHAFTRPPRGTKIRKMMCATCGGHAYARAVCVICCKPLCRRHTITADGQTYCRKCVPGYVM